MSFLASLPANIPKIACAVPGIPRYILSFDSASLSYVVPEISLSLLDRVAVSEWVPLRVAIIEELAKALEHAKYMGIEGVSLEKLDEYVARLPEIVREVMPDLISRFRYVSDGDMVMARDFNEVLEFAELALVAVLALVKILLDNNIDIPEEVMELVTELTSVLVPSGG